MRLTALADAFEDHLERSLRERQKDAEILEKIDVPRDRRFVGFDAFRQLIDSGVDVVLLATPPHFRPQQRQEQTAASTLPSESGSIRSRTVVAARDVM